MAWMRRGAALLAKGSSSCAGPFAPAAILSAGRDFFVLVGRAARLAAGLGGRFLALSAGVSSSLSLLSSESRGPFSGRTHSGRSSALGSTGTGVSFGLVDGVGTEAAASSSLLSAAPL